MTSQEPGLNEPTLWALADQGYEQLPSIQAKAILPALIGRDVPGCDQTDTGKTCAFAAPILQQLSDRKAQGRPIRALILTPTRELALQIQGSSEACGKYLPLRPIVIFDGMGQAPQVKRLRRGVDILAATPGRLDDLYGQKLIDLSRLEIFMLDEIDRMLDMGFTHDVHRILGWLPVQKQTLFFSATMPPEVQELVDSLLHNPAKVAINLISSSVEVIDRKLYYMDHGNKTRLLVALIRELDVRNTLVFTRTKHGANKVAGDLVRTGISAAAIHGNKSQTAWQQALADFKGGVVQVLVATDTAVRGLDIEELSRVLNYNLPDVPETYVHRIGHTGRAGRGGTATSFCDINGKGELKTIEKLVGRAVLVMEGHPWLMEALEPLPRDKKDRMANPEDAEVRATVKERRHQWDVANKAAAEARRAKVNQKVLRQPPQPEPAGETSAKKHRKRGQRNSAALEEALTATALARPVQAGFADFHKPDPLASDVIMDATARLLAPCGRTRAAPKKDKPVEQLAKKRKKAARPSELPAKPEPQAVWKRKGSGRHGGRGRPPEATSRTNGQKDSTEQPSLTKPYYLSHDQAKRTRTPPACTSSFSSMAGAREARAGASPVPTALWVSTRLLNNVGADAHIGPPTRPQTDRGRVWTPAATFLRWYRSLQMQGRPLRPPASTLRRGQDLPL